MAKFKCKNCEYRFEHFCDSLKDTTEVVCPICQSHWTEMIYKKRYVFKPFPVLPYADPICPLPRIGDRYWCKTLHAPCILDCGFSDG